MHQPSLKMNISQNTILSMTQAPYNNLIINMAHLGRSTDVSKQKLLRISEFLEGENLWK